MEIISIKHPHNFNRDELPPLSMALGYFDGVHLGHQAVIKKAKSIAAEHGFKSAVMTFDPHPSVVLGKSVKHVEYITPLRDKIELIAKLGIDYVFIVNFTREFASLLPQEFVDQYLIDLHVKHVIAGFDFTYGRMGKGTMETLPFHSREKFTYTVVPKLASNNNEKISSTLIRSMIREGRLEGILLTLGRHYSTNGTVIHGDKRGRTIGFPTANIELLDDYILPPTGVYCVRINVHGNWHEGVCNVGYKPTFKEEMSKKPSIEVHIFDFNQEIYGQEVMVEWHLHLRKEQKFNGIQELVAQIEKDKRSALAYFEKNNV
ncbi:bifunctional riboflavin kinase/FAD synthetase [Bacillus sp. DTU_2020_1000418_1_SI_GHA_SEK_038]|uniref:bifunctional riboflavin kinase/FAD synthetase n=1 Tax=Bacillus sp. DTU_2020_1000418_1_SI_GHA_SEK_038 TaxID=3077585 RepID=UPI0028E1F86E|nr:bifunctional riboflavin kinase/FAD synthetase [Bacillus sp. DTU_2020_1000418_1_SI_GHA_SEK_038]WNS77219.1 bifunctional riboflavin kinase/FAD synthetase [Bacillus sp. DTU_2020_1000418_1_SI_GHA_SEK_038]